MPSTQCTNAICVTVFNESGVLLRNTLASLVHSIGRFHCDAAHRTSHSTVCIIIDGRDRIEDSLREMLRYSGLLCVQPEFDARGDEFHVTEYTSATAARIFRDPGDSADSAFGMIRFIICIKAENRGKLESHNIFFNTLCLQLSPQYCYQIDTGSTLHSDAMLHLQREFSRDPRLAGLAPTVLLPTPPITASILETWQYCDFGYRNAMGWPFEVLTGYLSVLPGQASAVRWRAMLPEAADKRATTPLSAYLRGMNIEDPLLQLMYLAEDRVIGCELAFSSGESTRLSFTDLAKATTDPCVCYSELFRQRRRWMNSTMAVRLWIFARWSEWMRRADRSIAEKLHFSLSLLVQTGFAWKEFFAPAQLLATIALFASAPPHAARFVLPWLLACTAMELLLVAVIDNGPRSCSRIAGVVVLMTAVTPSALWLYFIVFYFPTSAAALLLMPAIALVPMARVLPRKGWARMVTTQFSPITYLFVASALAAYAVFRLHDVSWGTRGLTSSCAGALPANRLRRVRNYAFAIWTVANTAVAALAFTQPGYLVSSLNPVVEITCLMELVIGLGAVIFFAAARSAEHAAARAESGARTVRARSPLS